MIVGGGVAGASAAVKLRDMGYTGELSLIGEEIHLPYNRPALSKGYLRGEDGLDGTLLRPAADYVAKRIDLRLGQAAVNIDPVVHVVTLSTGERLAYDRLLVATGGRARRLPVPGASLEGVLSLRTVDDADQLRRMIEPGIKVVLVGMGFIGSEVAASVRQLGADVVIVETSVAPMASTLGDVVGGVFAAIHRGHGIRLLLGDSVTAMEGTARVESVTTATGRVLACDLVVVGIGIEPDIELLRDAGAEIGDGVVVDELCQTSLPDVYAAGDIAYLPHPLFGRSRVEHWNNAFNQGRLAAQAMLGSGEAFNYVHSFWSDQFDHSLEYVGLAPSWDELIFRGAPESERFLGFYLQDGRLKAAVGLNRGGDPEDRIRGGELKLCAALIRARARIDTARLASEDWLLSSTVVR